MNILGIIAEYNPFHMGHAYQIETLKRECNADYVIVAMSGNFVQRGAPALLDKYTRTHMALINGADLVLELPALFASASAEYFAQGGVSLLHNTGVVTHLGFGAESSNLPLLQKTSDVLIQSPVTFQTQLQQELKNGISFPAARAKALENALTSMGHTNIREIQDMLASPNNILAIEYLKALSKLESHILPSPILRKGHGYHDTSISTDFCSASAIRTYLRSNAGNLSDSLWKGTALPDSVLKLFSSYPHSFLFEDDFSQLVHYKLLTETAHGLTDYADCSPELANRMYHARHSFSSWAQFCTLLKTKNTTYTRISRLLLHLILNIRAQDYDRFTCPSPVPYLRVLGFQKASSSLLSYIKQSGTTPLITSVSDAEKQLSPQDFSVLQTDITASDIYNLALNAKRSESPGLLSDYRHPLVII